MYGVQVYNSVRVYIRKLVANELQDDSVKHRAIATFIMAYIVCNFSLFLSLLYSFPSRQLKPSRGTDVFVPSEVSLLMLGSFS